ncbi:DHA1 family tetracycline resistance protein-like MFS transporter [Inhella inkyongensis]|uniref:DHA1 family tetracycline resistance protein-like MFS transporter n=2 Tax=Inhella inkyongensis TaxID=392593 RepID=A0A840SC17_9BURK|nr:MFS transporter [Inhella inkyongensis]MBB5206001.1 DHA1 family tetracycline resistance protein-like MFS transporter [Inhella inkyongensis]
MRDSKASMAFIFATVLIDMISIGLIIPVLPVIAGSFSQTQAEHAQAYLWVAGAFGLANFLASPVLGALSDQHGRRPVLLLGFTGLALSFFVTASATALWMLVAVRLVSGAMQANISVANAYVADITPPADRAKRFGLLGAAFGIGFVLGPATGGVLGAIDLRLPFWVAGGMALLNLAYGYFVLPESLPLDKRRRFDWRSANPVSSLKKLTELKGVGVLVAVIALSSLAQFILHSSWVLFTSFKFGWGPRENGWSLFAVGLMSVIVQGGLLPRMLKRFATPRLVVLALASSALTYLGWALVPEGWMLVALIVMNVFGYAATASIQSIISNSVDATRQGSTMGAVASLNSLMVVLGTLIGPSILTLVAHLPRGDWRIGAPFLLCAALQALALFFALAYQRQHHSQAAPQVNSHA